MNKLKYDCIVIYQTINVNTIDEAISYTKSLCNGLKYKLIIALTDISLQNNSVILTSTSNVFDLYTCGNINREFTAWNAIFKVWSSSYPNIQYIFFNETANLHREYYVRKILRRRMVRHIFKNNIIGLFGELHHFNSGYVIPNTNSNMYINTAFFIINGINNFDLEELSYSSQNLRDSYKEYINFITNVVKGNDEHIKWYKYGSLKSKYEIDLKVKSIVLEHDLSTKIKNSNKKLINLIPNLLIYFYLKVVDKIYLFLKL